MLIHVVRMKLHTLIIIHTISVQAKITHQQQIEEFNRELEKKTSLLEEYAGKNYLTYTMSCILTKLRFYTFVL